MDTTLLYHILESKEGIEHTNLEIMESWLVQFPHNPVILKLINKKKQALGIELNELDWNQMALSNPRIDDFFIQLDYDIKIPDKHIDIETTPLEGVPESAKKSSDIEIRQETPETATPDTVPLTVSNEYTKEEFTSSIESNLEEFVVSDRKAINTGADEYTGELNHSPLQDSLLSSEEIENWTDDEDDEVILYKMEEIDENIAWSNETDKHHSVDSKLCKSSRQEASLSDFTSWLRSRNPNAKKSIVGFDQEKEVVKKHKKKKKSKKEKKKEKQQTVQLKKHYNININKRLKSVIEFADQSLLDPKDIISETLAEILVEQEHYLRAIDMYHRLSLAFPEKSVYFAEIIKKIQKK